MTWGREGQVAEMVRYDAIKGKGTDREGRYSARIGSETKAMQLPRISRYVRQFLHPPIPWVLSADSVIRVDSRVIYRRYASLYLVCGVPPGENELNALEVMHRYVECLDEHFGNVRSFTLLRALWCVRGAVY